MYPVSEVEVSVY